jgi:hypothetical protein
MAKVNTEPVGPIWLFDKQHWGRKEANTGLYDPLLKHFCNLLFNLCLQGRRVPIRANTDRSRPWNQWNFMVASTGRRKTIRFLKEHWKLIHKQLNLSREKLHFRRTHRIW